MGDELGDLRRLEEKFARAMQEMYAVGNDLAATRHRLELEREAGSPGRTDAASHQASLAARPAPPPATPPLGTGPVPARAMPQGTAPGITAPIPAPPVSAPPVLTAPGAHGSTAAPTAVAGTSPAPVPPVAPSSAPPPVPPVGTPFAPPGPHAPPIAPFWEREGFVTRLLGATGAVVTLAGLVMLLVLAVQQNWFGPVPRVVAGWFLAVGLILAAHWVRRRELAAGRAGHGAVALAATGHAAAYLCVIAMTAIYGWLPPAAGLAMAAVLAAGGLFLARRWNSQTLAVLIVSGVALLAPFVADGASWLLSAFIVVLAIASWPAQVGRSWPALTAARMIPAALVVIPTTLASQRDAGEPWAHLAITAVLAIAGVVMSVVDARRDRHPELATMTFALSALPLLVTAALLPRPWHTVTFTAAALGWLTVAGLGEATKKLLSAVTIPSVVAGSAALFLAIVVRDSDRWSGSLLLVAAAAYLVVAGATRSRLATWSGLAMTALALISYLRHPFTVLVERTALGADMTVVLVDSLFTVIVVAALTWVTIRSVTLKQVQRRWARSVAWFVGLSVATTGLVAAGVLIGRSVENASGGFRAGHALATILWMGTAVWLLGIGLRRAKDTNLSIWLGLGLAAISVAKLFLYDLAVLNGIWRVIAFIVVGLMLLGAGTGYAKALDRARGSQQPEPQPAPQPEPQPQPQPPPQPSPPSAS